LGALYAVDLHNGSRSKFDSYDQWGFGGTVLRANGKIISVSNRMVTAYPIPGEANGQN